MRPVLAIVAATLLSCQPAAWAKPKEKAKAKKGPILVKLQPSAGISAMGMIQKVKIIGTGFQPLGNVVRFGPVKLESIASKGGTEIEFYAPTEVPSGGEVPPMRLGQGEYKVTVTTAEGTSNALVFMVMDR
ncbi:MAG: hypothetical protein HY078_12970 [Elusimicrobia bacterium]|nr:hypothetical protein [Elusimicrobiota bacterium]